MAVRSLYNRIFRYLDPVVSNPPYRHVCQVGDPVLRAQAFAVPPEEITEPHIQKLIVQMKDVMQRYKVLGLSAPQLGIPLRVIAVNITPEVKETLEKEHRNKLDVNETSMMVVVNPVMRVTDYKTTLLAESCASNKGFSAVVTRYTAVQLTGLDGRGVPVEMSADGLLARILQHEMDHLDGKLYTDIMDRNTYRNDGWDFINKKGGKVFVTYTPEKDK